MFELSKLLPPTLVLFILPLLLILFFSNILPSNNAKTSKSSVTKLSFFEKNNEDKRFQWLASKIVLSPSSTFTVRPPFRKPIIFTGNPATVERILKIKFSTYEKGPDIKDVFQDVFGNSMFTVNGDAWKSQRTIASHGFSIKIMQKFIEDAVDFELSERLIPILSEAAKNNKVLDLQDIFQRFTFDNICLIAFGHDPKYLSPSFPHNKVVEAFDDALTISEARFRAIIPFVWKTCRFLNIGDEKKLKHAVHEIREFAISLIKPYRNQNIPSDADESNVLVRFLKYNSELDDDFFVDMIVGTVLAGQDTTSAALTWFFWLIHNNEHVEQEIVKEMSHNKDKKKEKMEEGSSIIEEIKDMVYTHAALCESMRLYPPAPINFRQAVRDDVLPDGTVVKRGSLVGYVTYAMGRSKWVWGSDWAEYQPERWLKEEGVGGGGEKKWRFVPRDQYSYPVFHGGPRICLGREMAFWQMKRILAGIVGRFKVVPAVEGFQPAYVASITAKMRGGFPVRIEEKVQIE